MIDLSAFKTSRLIDSIEGDGSIISRTIKVNPSIKVLGQLENEYKTRKTYTPVKGDKLFFLPGCEVPRVKVRELCKSNGTAIVRQKYGDATAIFSGSKTIEKFFSIAWYTKLGREKYVEWLNKVISLTEDPDVILNLKKEIEEIWMTEHDFVCLGPSASGQFKGYSSCYWLPFEDIRLDIGADATTIQNPRRVTIFPGDAKEQQKEIMKYNSTSTCYLNPSIDEGKIYLLNHTELYDQSAILPYLNSVVIDDEIYNQLDTMLKSPDTDNMVLAMEIMANCNYESSLVYLVSLIKNNWQSMRYTNMISHVNFRSLLAYIDNDNWYYFNSYKVARKILYNKNQDTPANIELLIRLNPDLVIEQGKEST